MKKLEAAWYWFRVGDRVTYANQKATVGGFSSAEPTKVRIYIKKTAQLLMVERKELAAL